MPARSRLIALFAAALILAGVIAGCGSSSSSSASSGTGTSGSAATSTSGGTSSSSSGTQIGFEGIPIEQGSDVAPASTTGTSPVDGIQCGLSEQLAYHIHAHLQVYDNGQSRTLPGGIGIPGSQIAQSPQGPVAAGGQCIYWLHTHAPDGVIHVESPTKRIYTLGNFFDEWRQPLSSTKIGTLSGKVTATVNGKPWTKSPRDIPLDPHSVIQLSVGSPVPPFKSVDWSQTQL
jgi:hypothetical protein